MCGSFDDVYVAQESLFISDLAPIKSKIDVFLAQLCTNVELIVAVRRMSVFESNYLPN